MDAEPFFSVKWKPPITGFFDFVKEYRKIINCPLGGSRVSRYNYNDKTICTVLSVGPSDNISGLPQRVSLSNFKIGAPITSHGVIYRYKDPVEPEYLLIRRNDSVSYIDLIRGNYRESQLFLMIQDLPNEERERLLKYDFDTLWIDLHMKSAEGDAYGYAKETYDRIRPYFEKLFEKVPPIDPNGKYLWLFPKGRPEWHETGLDEGRPVISESPFESALREFREETNGIDLTLPSNYLLFSEPVVEQYLGSNSKNYQTNYFVFETQTKPKISQFSAYHTPIREVSTGEVSIIKWVPFSQIENYLRPSRIELIKYIESNLPQELPLGVSSSWMNPTEINEFIVENSY